MFILEINIGAKLNTKEVYEIICTKIINNPHDTIFYKLIFLTLPEISV